MSKTLESILVWLLRIGIVLTLFSPVIYSIDFLFPYIVPRAAFFQIITEIAFGAAVVLALTVPHHRPRFSLIIKAVLCFFAVSLLTTLTSVDVSKSFIGTIERSFGFFNIVHFGMLFFAAIVAFSSVKQWLTLLTISLLVALYISIDFLVGVGSGEGSFTSSLMGNPTFLSGYLIFHIYFAAELFAESHKKWLKWVLVPVVIFFAITLFFTQVRGGFVGLSAGVLFLLMYMAWKRKTARPVLIGLLLISITGYGLIYANKTHPRLAKSTIIQRLTNFSLSDETIRARFAMWRMATSGLKERPIVGWGRENFSLVFNLHFDPSFDEAKVAEAWEDRAHNIIFDELVIGGVLGLAAYLLLMGTAFYAARKSPHALALLIAYFVQSLFGVETLNTYLPFFLYLAYCNWKNQPAPQEESKHNLQLHPAVAGLIGLVIIVPLFAVSVQTMRGNKTFHKTIQHLAQNNYLMFESSYNEGKNQYAYFSALRAEALITIHSYLFQIAGSLAQAKTYTLFAAPLLHDLDSLSKRTPGEQRLAFMLANAYLFQGAETQNAVFIDKAGTLMNQLLATAPTRKIYVEAKARLDAFRKLPQLQK